MTSKSEMIDANSAVAKVAHATNEVIAIYPITPSSAIGEEADELSARGSTNLWGIVPRVIEMQSEAGAAGAVHGALSAGALATTFTASQGLLLMIPNMFKIAGELSPAVIHVAARAIAHQALSIFGDHSDVMSVRTTGWAMLASNSPQEAMDFALIAQSATLESRLPFVHFFDGFRTSNEVRKVSIIPREIMRSMISDERIAEHRMRGLNPEHPSIKGTSQNPDVFFAARESVNAFYLNAPSIVENAMSRFGELTGRCYSLFEYVGAVDADRIVILMGSGAETAEETVRFLNAQGLKVGVLKVRLFRPFSRKHLMDAIPETVRSIVVLDRTKEPGAVGEPLYQDVQTALSEAFSDDVCGNRQKPLVIGGRFGVGMREFTPAMVKASFDNLISVHPKNHFTVGINDDITHQSLEIDNGFTTESGSVYRALFYGLASDGTAGANKNSIKIIGNAPNVHAQGYFVYDSKKAGGMTVSHLRFGDQPIRSTYLIQTAKFIACHNFNFINRVDILSNAEPAGVFLLAAPYNRDEVWNHLPVEAQRHIIEKRLRFFVINAADIARRAHMGSHINTIMQIAFFLVSEVIEADTAVNSVIDAVRSTYRRKGQEIVDRNLQAIEFAQSETYEVHYPAAVSAIAHIRQPVPSDAPEFVRNVTGEIMAGRGAEIPVSKLPNDGTYPTGTAKYERRNIAGEIPLWNPDLCIQCGDCSAICPHGVIRMKAFDPTLLYDAPASFRYAVARGKQFAGLKLTVQISPEDCTGCSLCFEICPAPSASDTTGGTTLAISMQPVLDRRDVEIENWNFFESLPDTDATLMRRDTTKGSQLIRPLFEFSGACAGCGETPYIKLLSQLFGDHAVIANATGCSSIYGGNLPTTPYTTRSDGRGPAWSNSLFEDAAEFGIGIRLASDKLSQSALSSIEQLSHSVDSTADKELLEHARLSIESSADDIESLRRTITELKRSFIGDKREHVNRLLSLIDSAIPRSVWIVGGDGWAYDIGFGGLDHVIASGENVNILVLDTEVYSNTGGQMSKATPMGAIAKFAFDGKKSPKKDLGMMAMSYGSVYVATVAIAYNRMQTIRSFLEAEAFDGPSIIMAYSHCITGHGISPSQGVDQQRLAVESGIWQLYRFDPRNVAAGRSAFVLDSKEPTADVADYMYNETRFKALRLSRPETALEILEDARRRVKERRAEYEYLATNS